ncbi:guanylate kinase [Paenibacillus abyssi]|uniref:Guanylate kinase n=1 Tax=Paenibacillus abyssi TaxID=1340531 RepID=A0A917G5T7_9BACL|nr:guanylate kinase [Paenibacillus abyssi]GGG23254.1 guanylate kinase [Paenibacillus abyssi]
MYELKDRELIFVFTGPDGSGRKTVADSVGATLGLKKVLSYATRDPRPGEVDGQDYHFISMDLYEQMESQNEFLESVTINNNKYGLREYDIEHSFANNGCIYLIMNRDGAEILKQTYGDHVIRLFIYADRATVEKRQRDLGLSEEVIANHLSHYDYDIAYQSECEHAFENYDLAHTVFEISNTLEGYLDRNLVEKD